MHALAALREELIPHAALRKRAQTLSLTHSPYAMLDQEKAKVRIQEFKVRGGQLVDKVREIIEEGKARRVIIKKEERVLLEFPLTVGVGGAAAALLLTPTLAAVGAIAALVTDVEVIIEHIDDDEAAAAEPEAPAEDPEPSPDA